MRIRIPADCATYPFKLSTIQRSADKIGKSIPCSQLKCTRTATFSKHEIFSGSQFSCCTHLFVVLSVFSGDKPAPCYLKVMKYGIFCSGTVHVVIHVFRKY